VYGSVLSDRDSLYPGELAGYIGKLDKRWEKGRAFPPSRWSTEVQRSDLQRVTDQLCLELRDWSSGPSLNQDIF